MIVIAFIIGLILGGIATYFYNMRNVNTNLGDVQNIREELVQLRDEVSAFEQREDEICQRCIDDTVQQFQMNAIRMSDPDFFYTGPKPFPMKEDEPSG